LTGKEIKKFWISWK